MTILFSALRVFWFGASGRDDRSPKPRPIAVSSPDAGRASESLGSDRLLGLPNREIVRRIVHGDQEMFAQLFDAYAVPLARWAHLMTRDMARAEDAAADVLAYVWERRDTWTVTQSVEAYLFGAVRAHVRNLRRTEQRRAALLARKADTDVVPGHADAAQSPEHIIESDERRARLLRALHTLPERQREAVIARWYRGMSYDEVGASMVGSGLTRDGLWLIEDGKISKAVRNFRTLESPLFVLNNIEMLGAPVRIFRPGVSGHRAPLYMLQQPESGLASVIIPPLKVTEFSFTSMIDVV